LGGGVAQFGRAICMALGGQMWYSAVAAQKKSKRIRIGCEAGFNLLESQLDQSSLEENWVLI